MNNFSINPNSNVLNIIQYANLPIFNASSMSGEKINTSSGVVYNDMLIYNGKEWITS